MARTGKRLEEDIALLPEWQKRIWAGYNMSPDGKVSQELFQAQARAGPADTQAPETLLERGRDDLNRLTQEKLGITILRAHDQVGDLLRQTHRFRATSQEGLLALAKDLARFTADSVDTRALQALIPQAKTDKLGSLKSLERLLATKIGTDRAGELMGPFHGVYNLRHADAHLAGDIQNAYQLASIDRGAPYVVQNYQLVNACVRAVYELCAVLEAWNECASGET